MNNMATRDKGVWNRLSSPATLPSEVTAQLLADVDVIARRMARRIATEIVLPAEFRRFIHLKAVTVACREALGTIVRLLHDGRGPRPGDLDRLGAMGARQAESGVPLEVLLRGYRVAAKVVWHEVIGQPAQTHDLPPATVIRATEQVLEYVDDISAAVGQAYLETRERLMRQRDRDRDHVIQRLLAGDSSSELRRLAATAGLSLQPPYRVCACAFPGGGEAKALETAWRRGALVAGGEPGVWTVLLPAEENDQAFWREVGQDAVEARKRPGVPMVRAAGPVAATLGEAGEAARQAHRALHVGRMLDPERPLHNSDEVGVFATLVQDRASLRRFVERMLGPLAADSPRHTELRTTLETLLLTPHLAEAASSLGLHRHTVVYRMRRLRELGLALDDPQHRHQLWLALVGLRLLSHPPDHAVVDT